MDIINSMQTSSLYLGIDGGGTKTLALIANDAGTVLGRGIAGPSNYHRVGIDAAYLALDKAFQNALYAIPSQDEINKSKQIKAVCLGLAGVDRPVDRMMFQDWLNSRLPQVPFHLTNDALPVLAAGTPQNWGVAVISGTGSIAYCLTPQGKLARAGGWGYIFGDEGSAYSIGLEALRAAAQSADGRLPETRLLPAILSNWNLVDPADLVNKVYSTSIGRENIAQLSILVAQTAGLGDKIAQGILENAGRDLARIGFAAAKYLDLTKPVPCAIAGSVLLHNPSVVSEFIRFAKQLGMQPEPITAVPEPAIGCLKLAAQLQNL